MNEDIIVLCMNYFERYGVTFLENSGQAVKCEYQGDDRYYWFSESPYVLRHSDRFME